MLLKGTKQADVHRVRSGQAKLCEVKMPQVASEHSQECRVRSTYCGRRPTDIQDIVGPASFWPRSIRRYFWTAHLSHFQRVLTAAFVWINGLNPEVYYDWCELKGFFRRGSPVHHHFQQLFAYFRQGRRYWLWSWHVLNRQHEWLDGTPCPRHERTRTRPQ